MFEGGHGKRKDLDVLKGRPMKKQYNAALCIKLGHGAGKKALADDEARRETSKQSRISIIWKVFPSKTSKTGKKRKTYKKGGTKTQGLRNNLEGHCRSAEGRKKAWKEKGRENSSLLKDIREIVRESLRDPVCETKGRVRGKRKTNIDRG